MSLDQSRVPQAEERRRDVRAVQMSCFSECCGACWFGIVYVLIKIDVSRRSWRKAMGSENGDLYVQTGTAKGDQMSINLGSN